MVYRDRRDLFDHAHKIVPVNTCWGCGFILPIVRGRRCCGRRTERKWKIGIVHISANRHRCRQDGRTIIGVRFGIALDTPRLIVCPHEDHMPKQQITARKRQPVRNRKSASPIVSLLPLRKTKRVNGPFYSQARKYWRIEYCEYGKWLEQGRDACLLFQEKHDAEEIGKIFARVATWEEWQKAVNKTKKFVEAHKPKGFIHYAERGRSFSIP